MKIKYIILGLLLSLLTIPAFSQTNTNSTDILSSAKTAVSTNINQVLVDILSGVKDAGKDIYGASKGAIWSSINFVETQAPDVIKEFLRWQFVDSIICGIGSILCILIVIFYAKKIIKYADDADYTIPISIISGGIVFVLIILTIDNIRNAAKIYVVPKVYLIEYVVDKINSN